MRTPEANKRMAELFKALANEKRIKILDVIKDREASVKDIAKQVNIHTSNTSQQLTVLRYLGVVSARREGRNIFYKIASPQIAASFRVLREIAKKTDK